MRAVPERDRDRIREERDYALGFHRIQFKANATIDHELDPIFTNQVGLEVGNAPSVDTTSW